MADLIGLLLLTPFAYLLVSGRALKLLSFLQLKIGKHI